MALAPNRQWALLPLLLLPIALTRATLMAESDTFWQIRTGLDILNADRIPREDTYSWTAFGRPWVPNSWLFDLLAALVYRIGDLAGVALAAALAIPVIAAVNAMLAHRLGARPLVTAGVLVVGFLVLIPWMSARPQLADYVAVPALLLLTAPAVQGRVGALIGIAAVQAVWVNLHAAAPLGIAVTAAAAVGAVIPSRSLWRVAAPTAAATLGTLMSPFGLAVFTQPQRVYAAASAISEWGSIRLTQKDAVIPLAILVLAVIVAARLRWYSALFVLSGLALAGCFSIRLLPIGAIPALAILAAGAAHFPKIDIYLRTRAILIKIAIAGLLAAELVVLAPGLATFGQPRFPLQAVAALPPQCKLFNSYTFGGIIILDRPDVLVSQDSRTDLYGADFVRRQSAIEYSSDGTRDVDQLGVTCALIDPATPLAAALAASPAWREEIREPLGVLFVRR